MGLDMYLTAKRFISSYKEEDIEFGKKIQEVVRHQRVSSNLYYS